MPGVGISTRQTSRAPEGQRQRFLPPTKTRIKIEHEVGPSTVKPWLTLWQHINVMRIDHPQHVIAEQRMRTPYATGILARTGFVLIQQGRVKSCSLILRPDQNFCVCHPAEGRHSTSDREQDHERSESLDGELRKEMLGNSSVSLRSFVDTCRLATTATRIEVFSKHHQ